jgi:hypothetical protein
MRSLIGATAVEALVAILSDRSQGIGAVEFATVPASTPLIQERRTLDSNAREVIERALRLRSDISLPFWDATMAMCFGARASVLPLFEAALYHSPSPSTRTLTVGRGCQVEEIVTLFPPVEANSVLALLSSVTTDSGERAHLPLLDFHLPSTATNERIALEALQALQVGPGYLLTSGKSYHFIGVKLVEAAAFPKFLARALLLSPVIDRSWIAHQIIEGRSALRISPRPGRDDTPRIVATFERSEVLPGRAD